MNKAIDSKISIIEKEIKSGKISIETYDDEVNDVKKFIHDVDKRLNSRVLSPQTKKQLKENRKRYVEMMKNNERIYNNSTQELKIRKAKSKLNELESSKQNYADIFYNEAHSDVGAFIYAEKDREKEQG